MVELVRRIVESRKFSNFITMVIIAAAFLVGVETYPDLAARYHHEIQAVDQVILWIFVAEVVLKMIAEFPRPLRYFRDPWNNFDFFIVAACFIPGLEKYALVLRLLRLLRVLKLITALPKLQILVGALLRSIPSMFYVAVLLGLLFYVYACAGVFLFGQNDPWHFGNLHTAMLSLFRVVTLEDWTDVMYTQMFGCADYPFPDTGSQGVACSNPQGNWWLGAGYFVSFVFLGTMIVLNLFIGVIMNGMDEAQKDAADVLEAQRRAERGEGVATVEHEVYQLVQQLDAMQESVRRIQKRIKERADLATAPEPAE